MAKPVESHQVLFLLQSRLQERQKKPNRKPERDHMDGLLKTPPNKCL